MDALELPVGSVRTFATARPRATKRCDSCGGDGAFGNGHRCEACDGSGRRLVHAFDLRVDVRGPDEDPVDVAIDRRDLAGSYAELDRALEALRGRNRLWLRALLELADGGHPQNGRATLAEAGLLFVVGRMPDPIHVPRDLVENAKLLAERRTRARARGRGGSPSAALAQRAKEMCRHARAGRSPAWIAAEYEVSVATVYRVVNGQRSA